MNFGHRKADGRKIYDCIETDCRKLCGDGQKKGGTSGVSYADTRLFRRNVHRAGRRGGVGCLGSNDKWLGIADCFGTRIPGRIGAGGLHRGGTFHWELPDDDLGAAETDFRGRAAATRPDERHTINFF